VHWTVLGKQLSQSTSISGVPVPDVAFVVLTLVLFAVLSLAVRGAERL
jgi:nitrate reductase NapE component